MNKTTLAVLVILTVALAAWAGDTGLGTSPFTSGDQLTATAVNAMNDAINDNAADILLMENFLPATMAEQSDCSTITAGWCRDTDDNVLYYWDGDSVESVGAGSVSTHESTYPHDDYDTHIAATGNTHSADLEDIADGVSVGAVTPTGGSFDLTAVTVSLATSPTDTLEASELNDDSDPHTLTASELYGTFLSNAESSGADEWDFPARSEGWDFCFDKEVDQNVTLDPNGTEQWYYRTDNSAYTQLSAGEALLNTTAGKSTICCHSTEVAVYCNADENWAEETP
jgi:hypothetical protein